MEDNTTGGQKMKPVIVIGMHRSGTSLMAEILGRFGVFMGYRVSGHNESLFFLRTNQYIFNIAHARWDYPYAVNCFTKLLYADRDFEKGFMQFLRSSFLNQLNDEYWGGRDKNALCGWKDPRNSFTLPIWLHEYPEAKVIHIYRNPIDVAASLMLREQSRGGKYNNHIFSCRCLDLDGGFDLWAEYVKQCRQMLSLVSKDRQLEICYENLLRSPSETFLQLEWFLGVSSAAIPDAVRAWVTNIDPSNAFKFKNNEELYHFYEKKKNHPLMEVFGYTNI